jgi:hypothetical protein
MVAVVRSEKTNQDVTHWTTTVGHCWSLSVIVGYRRVLSMLVIVGHCSELLVIVGYRRFYRCCHCWSLFGIVGHCWSLLVIVASIDVVIVGHYSELLVIVASCQCHFSELLVTVGLRRVLSMYIPLKQVSNWQL